MRRLLHSGWILLVLLLLASVASLYYLGWTQPGLRTLATQLSRKVGPVTLSIKGARGTLAGGASIDSVVLDHKRAHVEASGIELQVSMWALLGMNIRSERTHIEQALVQVLPKVDDNSSWMPHFLRAPLTLSLPDVQIDRVRLIATNEHEWAIEDLHASGAVLPYSINIDTSTLRYSGIAVQAVGKVLAAQPIGMNGKLHFDWKIAGQPDWHADASVDGNLDKLAILGGVNAPFEASFDGAALELNKNWHWQGDSQLKRFDLRAWGVGDALGIITGPLKLAGDRNGFHARGALTPPGLAAGALQVEFDGRYAERVVSADRIRLTHLPSGTIFDAVGTIGIVTDGPQLDLNGSWKNLRWPLADAAAPVHSAEGNYSLEGLWPFAFHAAGELRVKDLPSTRFDGAGTLARDRLLIRSGNLQGFGGNSTLEGFAAWSPSETWQLQGAMHGFNIESLRPGIRGHLDFQWRSSGEGFGNKGTLRGAVSELGGEVRGQRASGRANVELAAQDWLLQDVRLQLGATRIAADGRVGEHMELRFDVNADDLALLKADARGKLQARGNFRGSATTPMLQLDATGSGIVWDDVVVQSLTAKVSFDPVGSHRADTDIRIGKLTIGDRVADSLHFVTLGTVAAHRTSFDVQAPQLRVHAEGDATLKNGQWHWAVTQARAEDDRNLKLNLEAPAALEVSSTSVKLEPLCMRGTQARLCGSGSDIGGQRSVKLSAESMPLRSFTAGLIATTDFDGTLGVELQGEAAPAAKWRGSLRTRLTDAAIRHHFGNNRVESFDLGNGTINMDLGAEALDATVALNAGASGKVSGTLQARTVGSAWRIWPLTGALQLESDALGMLDSYVTEIDRASGRINADLRFSGVLGAPQLAGSLKVSDARIDAYQVNLSLRDLNFDARLNDNLLSLTGAASAGVDGKARFSGDLRWREGQPYGKLHLEGDNLLIVNIPEAKVYASPNVDLTINARRIDIGGTIALPYARLEEPEVIAGAVRTSSDEVIVNKQSVISKDPIRVFSKVTLKLGERVTINTSGLQGRLSGSLTTGNDESGFSRGTGELDVEEGKYTAYGRKLDITRGKLIFNNSPLGDPGVDLRATKKFPEITAGVNVRGTLAQPRMTFFSEPVASQSQIISLLIAGGSIQSLQASNSTATGGNAASNAAGKDMLAQGSAILAQQFGQKIGADVSVESNLNNDTSLVLGRYLSPRLYLSYGISLAEAINTIKMNYTINDKWAIRTEAGQSRSADIVYTLER
jgi:translocation and assembly module TamB